VAIERKKQLTQAQKTELSDQNMLREATKLILKVGTTKTTLKDVSILAGYSQGFASSRFGSKDGLFLNLERHHRAIWMKNLHCHLDGKKGLNAFLGRIDAMESTIRKEADNVRAMYLLWFDSVGQKTVLDQHLTKFNEDARAAAIIHIKEGIKAGEIIENIDVKTYALRHIAEVFGLIYLWINSPETVDIFACLRDLKKRTNIELKRAD
jgi:AcrR family transcriptional regulator